MAQTVDLGYVVGPTGPAGSDATLPKPEHVTVSVLFNSEGPALGFKYTYNREFVQALAETEKRPVNTYYSYTYIVELTCDVGTYVTLLFDVHDQSFDWVEEQFIPSRIVSVCCARSWNEDGINMKDLQIVQPRIMCNNPLQPSSSSEITVAQPIAVTYDVLCTTPSMYICIDIPI